MNVALVHFPGPGELAATVAQESVRALEAATAKAKPFCVALSGGRIARAFLTELARLVRDRPLDLRSVHFFWGDERCVPPNDPESNFGMANQVLLKPLGIPNEQIHRIRGELEPDVAAAEAAQELCHWAPLTGHRQPVLDLVLLGMGEDGHVASLFPGEPEAAVLDTAVYRPVAGPKPPPRRITLGYPVLATAREVWVLASGPGKEPALRSSLAGGSTPLGRLLNCRSATRILTDLVNQ